LWFFGVRGLDRSHTARLDGPQQDKSGVKPPHSKMHLFSIPPAPSSFYIPAMKKFFKLTTIVLIGLIGSWFILMALRKPWIEPIPGVRLEPTRPILLEKDVKPDSAFDLLRQAGAVCKVGSDQMHNALDEWKHMPWSLDGATNTLAILDQVQESLALARRAAEAPDPQVPTITNNNQEMPYVAKTLSIVRCFKISAKAKAVQGDYPKAFAELRSAIGFSSILTRGGLLIEHVVSIACHGMSCKTMRQITLNYPVEENLLREAIMFLEKTENGSEPWAECMRHEGIAARSYADEYFRNPSSLIAFIGYTTLSRCIEHRIITFLLGSTPTIMKKDMDACRTHLVSMAEKPFDQTSYDRFYTRLRMPSYDSLPRFLLTSRDPIGRIIVNLMLPAADLAHSRHIAMIADLRATRIVMAIVLFKRDEGRLPQKLAELTPKYLDKVPDDPFDGKQMKYRLDTDGSWVVYSVGADGKDDGGVEDSKLGRGKPDLIFGPTESP